MNIPEYRDFLALKDKIQPQRAAVLKDGKPVEISDLRKGEVRFIKRDEFPNVFRIMQEYGRNAQAQLGIDRVLRIQDHIQLSTYYPGDFYGWHKDGRIMSCSLLLTDKFTGGRLEFRESFMKKRAGRAVFFPNIEHRVQPVLTGVRDSLVVWWQ
jgi:hypothetical protein